MTSITDTGLAGIQRGLQGMQKAAQEIASANNFNPQPPEARAAQQPQQHEVKIPDKEMVESLVAAKQAALQVEASAKMIVSADEAMGTLLDVMA